MKFIHTADWHLGQTFYDHDRTREHEAFLAWLLDTLAAEAPDALVVAGDVFDTANPSSAAQTMLYRFLADARLAVPGLVTIIIAGNHDSGGRLEAPSPILEGLGVRVTGTVVRRPDGSIDLDRMLVPVMAGGVVKGWCAAVPFLRTADLPQVAEGLDPWRAGMERLVSDLAARGRERAGADLPLILAGHCHIAHGAVSELSERSLLVGGSEALPAGVFPADLDYVALGHLHKPQWIGRETLRYSGSPLPLSFAEIDYPHQVMVADCPGAGMACRLRPVLVPRVVDLLRVPERHGNLESVLEALAGLAANGARGARSARRVDDTAGGGRATEGGGVAGAVGDATAAEGVATTKGGVAVAAASTTQQGVQAPRDRGTWPYLEVRLLNEVPGIPFRARIEEALEGLEVRLARIDVRAPGAAAVTGPDQSGAEALPDLEELSRISPAMVFERLCRDEVGGDPPPDLMELFNEVCLADEADRARRGA